MRASENFQKVTLNLRPGDWDYIESIFKPQGISTSLVIRSIVANFVDKKRGEEPSREYKFNIEI